MIASFKNKIFLVLKFLLKFLKISFLLLFFILILIISLKFYKSEDLKKIRNNENLRIIFILTTEDQKVFEGAYFCDISFINKKIFVFPISKNVRLIDNEENKIYLKNFYKEIFNPKNKKDKKQKEDKKDLFPKFVSEINNFYALDDIRKIDFYVYISSNTIQQFNNKFLNLNENLDNYENKSYVSLDSLKIIDTKYSDETVFWKYINFEIFFKTFNIFNIYKFLDLKIDLTKNLKRRDFFSIIKNFNLGKIADSLKNKNFKIKDMSYLQDFSLGKIKNSNLNFLYFIEILIQNKRLSDEFQIIFITRDDDLYGKNRFYIKNILKNFENIKKVNLDKKPIIEVLNAAGEKGLSLNITRKLRDNHFDVQPWGNYPFRKNRTMIIDRKNNFENAELVYNFLQKGIIISKPDKNSFVDITIILGKDFVESFQNEN
jgi:hypothetical protein